MVVILVQVVLDLGPVRKQCDFYIRLIRISKHSSWRSQFISSSGIFTLILNVICVYVYLYNACDYVYLYTGCHMA